ncbi:hypothetical protein N5F00_23365 [Pseudomonas chengduensis]|nr:MULTISPECIES: hypothetical protein [Pseudomonas]MDH1732446.1 hypothetical protein [Pseudomonas chengduensis]
MSKKKKADRTFTAKTNSPVIAEFQKLVSMKGGHFPWAQMLEEKEMRFVYDMLAWAEARQDFIPSAAQGRWGAQILLKLKGAAKQWKAAHGGRSKMPSARTDFVARRRAKEHLKRHGILLRKTTPSDIELVKMLNDIGAISEQPSRATAKKLLINWSAALILGKTIAAPPPPQPPAEASSNPRRLTSGSAAR